MREARAPVIIIGMHRSGTTMVVEMLHKLGLFIGKRRERNQEALLFLQLDDWILGQSGAAWDNPEPIRDLLAYDGLRRRVTGYLRHFLNSPRSISYLGAWRYLRHRSLNHLPFPWGWKDPRSTFTLPLWLDLFPQARVLHVCRHGVDVAVSLRHRERGILAEKERRACLHDLLYTIHRGRANFTSSARCATLEGGFALWEEHMAAARRARTEQPAEAFLELEFEEVLADPVPHLLHAAQFCGLAADEAAVEALVSGVRADRACAFAGDAEATAFAGGVASRLAVYGYEHRAKELRSGEEAHPGSEGPP